MTNRIFGILFAATLILTSCANPLDKKLYKEEVDASSISFDDLQFLINKTYSEINETLINKGWFFKEKIEKSTYAKYTWQFDKEEVGVFTLIIADDNHNTINYKTSNSDCNDQVLTLIKESKCELIETYTTNNVTTKFYQMGDFVIEFSQITGMLSKNRTLYVVGYMQHKTYMMLKEFR